MNMKAIAHEARSVAFERALTAKELAWCAEKNWNAHPLGDVPEGRLTALFADLRESYVAYRLSRRVECEAR